MAENVENMIMISLILVLAFLTTVVFFLITQQKLLQLIEPQHKQMNSGLVWLQLIPVFGWIWQFIVVTKIANSIQAQLLAQDSDTIIGSAAGPSERPTYRSGIAYCTLAIVSTCFSVIPVLWSITFFASVAMIITWIIYWVELEKYNRVLKLRSGSGTAA